MSIQDERELRGRLGGLLDSVEAAPAPVANAMRRGRVMRMRRWVSAAAGVAVLAAGAVALPKLIDGNHAVAPAASRHYTVTVQDLGPTVRGGLIGAGTINGKRWRILLDNSLGGGCAVETYLLSCGSQGAGSLVGAREINFDSAGAGGTQFQLGNVGADVTRVVIRLSNGTTLDLRPVSAEGYRWVAVAAPLHAMVEAETFVGGSEYQYAVPYVARTYTDFVTWLRPGQTGVPRASAQLGSGEIDGVAWRTSISIGPWGYCVTFADGGSCVPSATRLPLPRIGKPLLQITCGTLFNSQRQIPASSGVVALPAGVKNVVLRFAGGSRMRLVATLVGGMRVVGYAIPARPRLLRTMEFGFAGQYLGDAPAPSWGC